MEKWIIEPLLHCRKQTFLFSGIDTYSGHRLTSLASQHHPMSWRIPDPLYSMTDKIMTDKVSSEKGTDFMAKAIQ